MFLGRVVAPRVSVSVSVSVYGGLLATFESQPATFSNNSLAGRACLRMLPSSHAGQLIERKVPCSTPTGEARLRLPSLSRNEFDLPSNYRR